MFTDVVSFIKNYYLCVMIEIEKQEEKAYSKRISREMLARIKRGVHNYIVVGHRYRDVNYSAKRLAEDIKTNTRYLSAALQLHYGCNYSVLVNRMRVEDAKLMLADPESTMTMEDISISCGFANRQSFYTAFGKYAGMAPKEYRRQMMERAKDDSFELIEF